ncbi:MAG TPA: PD-(D/E)XK nuclease family protein [Ilumatobacteraceae bacterium]
MEYPVPTSLSPSRVDAFTSCPLQFRFASIEKLPEAPSIHATKGSLVHRALELLFCEPAVARTPEMGQAMLARAVAEYRADPEFTELALDEATEAEFIADAAALTESYFRIEDPRRVREIGIELRLEAQIGALAVRGVIDRLDLDDDGGLVVTDYKTGRPPFAQREQQRLGGVNFYAFLCQEVLGRRPSRIRLMYLRTGEVIEAIPSEQSVRFLTRRTAAVWQAVERACLQGDFRPRPSALCGFCSFRAWCPSFGGDPDRAAIELPIALGLTPA